MDKVSVIGVGRLGLCFCLCLESRGYDVLGVDVDPDYVEKINNRTLHSSEPGVNDALRASKTFSVTTDLDKAIDHADLVFTLVATPSLPGGMYDHSQILQVIDKIKNRGLQSKTKHLVISSTTMPGFCNQAEDILSSFNWTVSYNPEFIAQGTILKDLVNPDLILIGESHRGSGGGGAGAMIAAVYERLCLSSPKIHRMSLISAEMTKVALNCFLTMKIAFANMVGDLATEAGAQAEAILKAIGSDSRIGSKYLSYGFGYGGPCLPRDNRAMQAFAEQIGLDADLCQVVDTANKKHLEYQVKQFQKKHPLEEGIKLGPISYKKGTSSIEESQQLKFACHLAQAGYRVTIEDQKPVVEQVKRKFGPMFHDYVESKE